MKIFPSEKEKKESNLSLIVISYWQNNRMGKCQKVNLVRDGGGGFFGDWSEMVMCAKENLVQGRTMFVCLTFIHGSNQPVNWQLKMKNHSPALNHARIGVCVFY